MSFTEYRKWQAYAAINPFGAARDDLRIGILGLRIAQALGAKNAKLQDFVPRFETRRQQSQTEMMNRWKLFASVHNQSIGTATNG